MHIPFPPNELFAWLPWRREILQGLLGADVVGFQTPTDAQNFSRAARHFTSAAGSDALLRHNGRPVRVSGFPISIDYSAIDKLARADAVLRRAREIRRQVGATRRVLLGVDRLDYTKGLDARFLAYEELLRRKVTTVDDCVLIQIAVPSRETVAEYAELRNDIEQIVGRIHGEFDQPGHVAVHYFRRNLKREELIAYFVAADVMVVTPLRDGMNLVAKEYVAARTENSGVLVLSEFAGTARELKRALLVNPRDIDGMVRALDTAIHLPRPEARTRMKSLRSVVRRHDVFHWAASFVGALES
jgi:trehalose 6-phosphate synthase